MRVVPSFLLRLTVWFSREAAGAVGMQCVTASGFRPLWVGVNFLNTVIRQITRYKICL